VVSVSTERASMLKGRTRRVATTAPIASEVERDTEDDVMFSCDQRCRRDFAERRFVVREFGGFALLKTVTGTGTDEATRDGPARGAEMKGPRRGHAIIRFGGGARHDIPRTEGREKWSGALFPRSFEQVVGDDGKANVLEL
jgi:hypothetical protein